MSTESLSKAQLGTGRWRGLVLPGSIALIWALASSRHWVDANMLPSPVEVGKTAWGLIASWDLWTDILASLARALSGFAIAGFVGVVVGVALGSSRWANRLGAPMFNGFRQVAIFAWIPLISAWFGGGEGTKVAFIVIAAAPPVVLNTMEGVRSVSREHVELARVLELGRRRLLLEVVIPSALPRIMTGLHLSLVVCWLATVGAEFFLQISPGVARILIEGRALTQMDLVLVGMLVVGLIGLGLTSTINAAERRVLRWRPASQRQRA